MPGMAIDDQEQAQRLRRLAEALLVRTRAGEAKWKFQGGDSIVQRLRWRGGNGELELTFTPSNITRFVLNLHHPDSREHLAQWRPDHMQDPEGVKLLAELWEAAKTNSGIADEVLDDLYNQLGLPTSDE